MHSYDGCACAAAVVPIAACRAACVAQAAGGSIPAVLEFSSTKGRFWGSLFGDAIATIRSPQYTVRVYPTFRERTLHQECKLTLFSHQPTPLS